MGVGLLFRERRISIVGVGKAENYIIFLSVADSPNNRIFAPGAVCIYTGYSSFKAAGT